MEPLRSNPYRAILDLNKYRLRNFHSDMKSNNDVVELVPHPPAYEGPYPLIQVLICKRNLWC